MTLTYNIAVNEGIKTSVTVFVDGVPQVATKEHPNFNAILDALNEPIDEAKVVELFDLSKPIFDKFDHLSERVSVAHGEIFFDGDKVDGALSKAIVKFYTEDSDDWQRLVSFMEKIATNPNKHSQENLYTWLANASFAIAPDGDFIGYKAISQDRKSINSGKATVDGEVVEGRIPNEVGSVIEMPRSDVQHDPYQGCHTGLHVGTWDYAQSFGGASSILVKVKVNPRDVVSVPVDCGAQKLRCCRYTVLEDARAAETNIAYSYSDAEQEYDDDWDDEDDYDDFDDYEIDETWITSALASTVAALVEGLESQPYKAQTEAAELAEQREARRAELTDFSILELSVAALDAGVDLIPIVSGQKLVDVLPDIVDAIVALEFPTE